MISLDTYLNAKRTELHDAMASGYPVSPETLCNHVYHGVSLGLPGWIERLTWKKFMKTFYLDAETGGVRGWNIRAMDNGLDAEWQPKLHKGKPITFGHFDVTHSDHHVVHPNEIILDYGRGGRKGNGLLNGLRDPIVALEPESPDVLLGWSYLALGNARVRTPSYFLLMRGSDLTDPVSAPN